MMRRLLLLLLALGLWQIARTQVHCDLAPSDCEEAACELCPAADIAPLVSGFDPLCSPPPTPRLAVAPSQSPTASPLSRHNRGRAPPR